MDRSTRATLSTYNTWIQLSRLQKIYHFQSLKLRLATTPLTVRVVHMQQGRDLMFVNSFHEKTQLRSMRMINLLQTTYLNPGIVSAESSLCATIH